MHITLLISQLEVSCLVSNNIIVKMAVHVIHDTVNFCKCGRAFDCGSRGPWFKSGCPLFCVFNELLYFGHASCSV